jgi:hypothetical protein
MTTQTVRTNRWTRLQADLQTAGIETRLTERSYPGGVSRSIQFRSGDRVIHIGDQWWRKNLDVWLGWEVGIEGPDAITIRTFPLTKRRSEVVAAVQAAMKDRP